MSDAVETPIVYTSKHGCRRLEGKVAIVTAGTLGIGRAIVQRLLEEGASVVLCSRKQKNVDETMDILKKEGYSNVYATTCNVGNLDDLKALVQFTLDRFKKIDLLVCNAAANPAAGISLDQEDWVFDKIFSVNVKSIWQLIKLCKPHMSSGSSILMISSIGGYQPSPPLGLYGVSKTAVIGLGKMMATELGPYDIRCNVLAPGLVRTRFAEILWKSEEARKMNQTWLNRIADPVHMVGTAAFLLSDDAAHITGETITVCGGQNSRL